MKYIVFVCFFTLLVSCTSQEPKQDLIADRIDFVIDLKKQTGDKAWSNFSAKAHEGPLFYFDDTKTHIFFADDLVKEQLSLDSNLNSYFTLEKRFDSIPFHMEVQIEFDKKTAKPLLLNNPIEFCSSPEETQKIIPSVTSTEMWSTMVIHEMFHHFQFNNETYKEYMKQISELDINNRDLQNLIATDSVFTKHIETENEILLKLLNTSNTDSIHSQINNFLNLRKIRRDTYTKQYANFVTIEDAFEKMEGSARFIEYQSMLKMKQWATSENQLQIANDSLFNNYTEFKNFNLLNEDFEYLQTVSYDYYYTLGFNLIRVLTKLNIDYQERIFNNPNKSLTTILTEYQNSLPNNI